MVSKQSNARRMFRLQLVANCSKNFWRVSSSPGLNLTVSLSAMVVRTRAISAVVGAGIRTRSVRDLMGEMILEVVLQTIIRRMLLEYFSMVLLNAAWASLLRESASLITTTLNLCLGDEAFAVKSTCSVEATSLRRSWITTLSLFPISDGVISK